MASLTPNFVTLNSLLYLTEFLVQEVLLRQLSLANTGHTILHIVRVASP